ncbi:MAG: hypothetical protein RIE58_05595 [Vicingaceae bacterium]
MTIKNIAALTLGLIFGGLCMVFLKSLFISRFAENFTSEKSFPFLFSVLLIQFFSAFVSGLAIGFIADKHAIRLALIASLIYTFSAMIELLINQQPGWFAFCQILVFVPATYFGCLLVVRRNEKPIVKEDPPSMTGEA